MSLSAVTPSTGITRECERRSDRSAAVTAGNEDPTAVGAPEAGTGEGATTDGVTEGTSDGVKATVSEPVPDVTCFAVSITVEVSPLRARVILVAPLSGLIV